MKVLLKWYDENKRSLPWRELFFRTKDPYYVWVSEIMLQQTTIAAVIPKYNRLVQELPNVTALADASEEQLRSLTQGLGYYRRFRSLHQAAKSIVSWPRSYDEWIELPGIGPYTAAAISSITLNEVRPVVDGNVERVVARLLQLPHAVGSPELKKKSYEWMSENISKTRSGDFNQAVMELGQTVCTPNRQPNCPSCPLKRICLSFKRKTQFQFPFPKIKKDKKQIQIFVDISKTLMRGKESPFLKDTFGYVITSKKPVGCKVIGKFSHLITEHKITAYVIASGKIKSWENLTSSLDQKALNCVGEKKPGPGGEPVKVNYDSLSAESTFFGKI